MNVTVRAGAWSAAVAGIGRVARAPLILASVWMMTVAVTLPFALTMRALLAQHLGSSLAADSATSGVNYDWMLEFGEQATGLGVTFKPTIIGFGAVLDNASALADGVDRPTVLAGAAGAYLLLWIFLAGGIIDRFARDRPTRAHGFFSASGVFFFRFLRLALVQAVVYGLLFTVVHRSVFDAAYPFLTRDITVERTAFLIRLALYLAFGIVIAFCMLVFDYAKIRAVVEDRRSMIGAIGAALGFIQRNLAAVAGLFLVNLTLFVLVLALYGLIAPGVGRGGVMTWLGLAAGQLYVIARLCVKLAFWASETALFQSRLAHAGYVASPEPFWPDSPAAEGIQVKS